MAARTSRDSAYRPMRPAPAAGDVVSQKVDPCAGPAIWELIPPTRLNPGIALVRRGTRRLIVCRVIRRLPLAHGSGSAGVAVVRATDHADANVVWATAQAVSAIASSSGSLHNHAQEALSAIASALPSVATAICLWDPLSGRHVAVANAGYTPEVLEHLNHWFIDHDPLFARMIAQNGGALRWRDVGGYRDTKSVEEVFRPAGFDEGLTARLVSPSGAYAGSFHLSSDDRRYPREADVAVVDSLRSTLACLLDVTAAPRTMARLLAPEGEAFLVDDEGHVAALGDNAGSSGELSKVSR